MLSLSLGVPLYISPVKTGTVTCYGAWFHCGPALLLLFDACRLMLTVAEVDIDAQNKYGISPAMIAASKGKTEALRILAGAGAKLDAQDAEGVSALHYAASEVGSM